MKKRLLVLMNCVLNMNTRAPGIAIHRGAVEPLVHKLMEENVEFVQVPCPEATFVGLKRWWFTKELYDSVPYRRHCRKLAEEIANIVKRYYEGGYSIVLIGLSLSPSCGVLYTQSDPSWEGRPFNVGDAPPVVRGMGVFIEELAKALERAGIEYSAHELPPALIYPLYRVPKLAEYPANYDEALNYALKMIEDD